MDIVTFLIIGIVIIVAWILLKFVLKITGLIFRIGCLLIAVLAVVGLIFLVL